MDKFYLNLKKYQKYEVIASKKIEILNNCKTVKFCNNFKYDFKTDDKLKYEVKADEMSIKTNNIFIEFEGYGKPSGIAITHSNFYIITDTINYYKISTSNLRNIIEDKQFNKICKTKDGLTSGYLFSKDVILKNSQVI